MISKEDYEILKPFEQDFSRVLDSQYKLPTPLEQDQKILDIVKKYNPKYPPHNWGCAICAFNLYAAAGRLFREYVAENQEVKTRTRRGRR